MSASNGDFIGGLLGTRQPAGAIRPRSFSLYDPRRPRLRGPEVDPEPAPEPFPPPAAPLGPPVGTRHPDDRESRADSLSPKEKPPRPDQVSVPALGRQPERRLPRAPAQPLARPAPPVAAPDSHPVTPAAGPVREPADGRPGERGPQGPEGPRGLPGPPGSPVEQGETPVAPAPAPRSDRHDEPRSALRPQATERRAEVAAWSARRARTQERTVEITIDRLEVRAQPAPPAPSRRAADRRPALNLDDYLRQRDNRNGVGT